MCSGKEQINLNMTSHMTHLLRSFLLGVCSVDGYQAVLVEF